ncbi:MAG: hypothetical protein Q7S01_05375 [bacterium]|nr:hypothetical protein [bacterium]
MRYVNTNLKVPLLEAIDRITILMLKRERLTDEQSRIIAEKEYDFYRKVLDSYRDDGLVIKDEWITRMKETNAALWDVEAAIREARKNKLTLEDVGRLAVQLRDKNNERNIIKGQIAGEVKIDFYEVPIESSASDTSLKLPLPEAIDRVTIAMLKLERLHHDNNRAFIKKEYTFYRKVLDSYRNEGIDVKDAWVEEMKEINGHVWDIESAIRQGREDEFGLEEMGRRTLDLRELSKVRVACKKKIAEEVGLDFHEVKGEVT